MTIFQRFLSALSTWVPTVLGAAGVVALAGLSVLGGVSLWRVGALDKLLPKERERIVVPVHVTLVGPTVGVKGGQYTFTADVTGDAGDPTWSVEPQGDSILHTFNSGRAATFTSLTEGQFLITVMVGGDGKQASSDSVVYENFEMKTPEEMQPAVNQTASSEPELSPATVEELTVGALRQVGSHDRAERLALANSFRTLAARMKTYPGDVDAVSELHAHAESGMPGGRAGKWGGFIDSVEVIKAEMEKQGKGTTPESFARILVEMANVLQSSRD